MTVPAQKERQRSVLSPGFTLVELLVVIAVIALLLAFLIPALHGARRVAYRVRCGTNLKQIALANHLYLDENDNRFYQHANANLTFGGWRGLTENYWVPRPFNSYLGLDPNLSDETPAKAFYCPADKGGVTTDLYEKVYRVHGNSYQTNWFLIGPSQFGPFSPQTQSLDEQIILRLPGMSRQKVCDPARLLLVGDYGWISQWHPKKFPPVPPFTLWKDQTEWHGRTNWHNLAFLDGHVSFMEIFKGVYLCDTYRVQPFRLLDPNSP